MALQNLGDVDFVSLNFINLGSILGALRIVKPCLVEVGVGGNVLYQGAPCNHVEI